MEMILTTLSCLSPLLRGSQSLCSQDVALFKEGRPASDAIKLMAEGGNNSGLLVSSRKIGVRLEERKINLDDHLDLHFLAFILVAHGILRDLDPSHFSTKSALLD